MDKIYQVDISMLHNVPLSAQQQYWVHTAAFCSMITDIDGRCKKSEAETMAGTLLEPIPGKSSESNRKADPGGNSVRVLESYGERKRNDDTTTATRLKRTEGTGNETTTIFSQNENGAQFSYILFAVRHAT